MRGRDYCIHFNGLISEICRAGHNYLEVSGLAERKGIAKRIPCLPENKGSCPDFKLPTKEELAAFNKEIAQGFADMIQTRGEIMAYLKENKLLKKSISGRIPCPICKEGTVSFTYAGSVNGLIHACCSTLNCINWME